MSVKECRQLVKSKVTGITRQLKLLFHAHEKEKLLLIGFSTITFVAEIEYHSIAIHLVSSDFTDRVQTLERDSRGKRENRP